MRYPDAKIFGRKSLQLFGVLMASLCSLTGCGGKTQQRFITIATGGTGGIYYPLGGALARVFSQHIPGLNASAQATAGSLVNCGLIQQGKADVAFTMADVAFISYQQGTDVIREPYSNLRTLASVYDNYLQIVTYPGSAVRSVADLRGKRVAVGAPGSGTEFNARRVLQAYGLAYSDIHPDYLSFTEVVAGLKNRSIDAGFINASYPVSAIVDLDTSIGVRFLPVEAERAESIQKEDPSYFPAVVPKGTYKSLPADLPTVGVANLLVVRADLPEELVYKMASTLFEQRQELIMAHAVASSLTSQRAVETRIPLHPGAARYYREAGVIVPGR